MGTTLRHCRFGAFGVDPANVGHVSETDLTTGWIEGSDSWFSTHLTELERLFPFTRNLLIMDGILQVRCIDDQCVMCWQFIPDYSRKRSTSTRRVACFPHDYVEELVPALADAFRRTPRRPGSRHDVLEPVSVVRVTPTINDMLLLLGFSGRYPGTILPEGKTICPTVNTGFGALCHIAWSWCRRRGTGCALVVYPEHPQERDGEGFDESGWDLLLAPGSSAGADNREIDCFDAWPESQSVRGATPQDCVDAYQRLFTRWKVQEANHQGADSQWQSRLNIPMSCLDQGQVPDWEWDHWVRNRLQQKPPEAETCATIASRIVEAGEADSRMTLRLVEVLGFMDANARRYDELCRICLARLDLDDPTIEMLAPSNATVR